MKIGLALSGGGIRATVFHLGVLKRIAETDRWSEITFISTVSGGSLCIALVFEKTGQKWPTASEYLNQCLPEIETLLTGFCLESAYKRKLLFAPWKFMSGRASVMAQLMREHWGISSNVNQMPDPPRWEICTTCYETGKNWRFSKKRMGDYVTNYVNYPDFPLAEAAAASAAVPGLIGPLRVHTAPYKWHKYPKGGAEPTESVAPTVPFFTLWDGGVYENLGVEALFKPQSGLRDEIDYIIVSDASKPLGLERRRFQFGSPQYIPPFRLIDIATDQVRAVRLRTLFQFITQQPDSGVILRMGGSAVSILNAANAKFPEGRTPESAQPLEEVQLATDFPTTLRQISSREFAILLRHGYEVADYTFFGYKQTAFISKQS